MDGVNKTLYIPLYGKAFVSGQGILLEDPKAEEIWAASGFTLKGKAASKWLAYYMAMRAAVMDRWTATQLEKYPDAVVLHLGCGLDNRSGRLGNPEVPWYDVDMDQVIRERKRHYEETENYRMIAADLRSSDWLEAVPAARCIVVMEGISMYLNPGELAQLLTGLRKKFPQLHLLTDCYSTFAAKMSKYKNPINDVGVTEVYGMDTPEKLAEQTGLRYVRQHDMTPTTLIRELSAGERIVFSSLYAGRTARSLYRLYEFEA